jgi:DNA-binding response OmpR family regulator
MNNLESSRLEGIVRVLHVDDDSSFLEISKKILMMIEKNFLIDSANSVDEAFSRLVSENYDVVISDYEMPEKDGLTFLKNMRDQQKQIPFILFTGRGREEVAIRALNLGADGYVNKIGNPETVYGELAHYINQSVEKGRAEQALRERDIRLKKLSFSYSWNAVSIFKKTGWNILFAFFNRSYSNNFWSLTS